MRGLLGRPWLDLTPWLDVAAFDALREELDAGVARADGAPVPGGGCYIPVRMEKEYERKHDPESCVWHPNARLFPGLLQFIARLPFRQVGRLMIMPDRTAVHADVKTSALSVHHFVWMQVGDKRFYILDGDEKHYVTAKMAWFNVYDPHGCEWPKPGAYSLRVDGIFTEDFQRQLGGGPLPYRL